MEIIKINFETKKKQNVDQFQLEKSNFLPIWEEKKQ